MRGGGACGLAQAVVAGLSGHDGPPRARGHDRRAGVQGGAHAVLQEAYPQPRVTRGSDQVDDAFGRGTDSL